jgi:hypothetical protein
MAPPAKSIDMFRPRWTATETGLPHDAADAINVVRRA